MNFIDCSSGSVVNVAPAMTVQWQDITNPNNITTYATQSINAGASTASYLISPYTNLPDKSYTVQVLVTVPSKSNI
jgi:hypothetical protein